jgi:hypothetical protein
MARPDGQDRAIRAGGLGLALAGAISGLVVAFGAWSVGYCGDLTPDSPSHGALRDDLCRGTSGDLMSGAVFASWILAAAAPLLGMRWALRRGAAWPLVATAGVGAVPMLVILILAEVLPQS